MIPSLHHDKSPPSTLLVVYLLFLVLSRAGLVHSATPSTLSSSFIRSSTDNSTLPKRGLIYISTSHPADYSIFRSPTSPLTWYYNYSPWPSETLASWTTDFTPMVHGAADAASAVDTIKSILHGSAGANDASGSGNQITHVLTFNEPDGDTASGGSNSTPAHAAQVYIDTILPLRGRPWNLEIGLPATTGSSRGLQWLRDFNDSCFTLAPQRGCEFDFVPTHWYGDFAGMASWLGQVHDMFPRHPLWLTEFAIPQADAEATEAFMNQSLPYLDTLTYVEKYAWFGTFRADDANEWTGDGVSLLDGEGRLSSLGAQYLGGDAIGFRQGMAGVAGIVKCSIGLVALGVIVSLVTYVW